MVESLLKNPHTKPQGSAELWEPNPLSPAFQTLEEVLPCSEKLGEKKGQEAASTDMGA